MITIFYIILIGGSAFTAFLVKNRLIRTVVVIIIFLFSNWISLDIGTKIGIAITQVKYREKSEDTDTMKIITHNADGSSNITTVPVKNEPTRQP